MPCVQPLALQSGTAAAVEFYIYDLENELARCKDKQESLVKVIDTFEELQDE